MHYHRVKCGSGCLFSVPVIQFHASVWNLQLLSPKNALLYIFYGRLIGLHQLLNLKTEILSSGFKARSQPFLGNHLFCKNGIRIVWYTINRVGTNILLLFKLKAILSRLNFIQADYYTWKDIQLFPHILFVFTSSCTQFVLISLLEKHLWIGKAGHVTGNEVLEVGH